MTHTATVVGFSFVFKNTDFLLFALFQYFRSNFSAFNYGSAYFNVSVVYDCQNLVEYYFGINISSQFFDKNAVAFLNAILFSVSRSAMAWTAWNGEGHFWIKSANCLAVSLYMGYPPYLSEKAGET